MRKTKVSRRRYRHHEEAAALRLNNPFKIKKVAGRLRRITASFLPIIIISWVGLLLYLPYFQINRVSYSGLKVIKASEIDNLVQGRLRPRSIIWPVNNYFIFREDSMAQLIDEKFSINSVLVTKSFPNMLNVQVEEKTSAGIYDNGSGYYLLDGEGNKIKYLRGVGANEFSFTSSIASTTILSTSPSTTPASTVVHLPDYRGIVGEFGDYPIIYDQSPGAAEERELLIDPKIMDGLMAFYNALRSIKAIHANYFTINEAETGITVLTDKPYSVKFQPDANIENQISKLQIFLKYNKPVEYVDLRFGDRIYWK